MTLLGFTNRFILQWFCIRLTKHVEDNIIKNWSIQYWVVPTTGWNTDYRFLNNGPKFLKF